MEGNKIRVRDTGNAGRCVKERSKRKYSKKRRYHGKKRKSNDETSTSLPAAAVNIEELYENEVTDPVSELPPPETVSASKIVDIIEESAPIARDTIASASPPVISGYRLMDMSILADVFALLSCPGCHDTQCLQLRDIDEKKMGLARCLQFQCSSCLYIHKFFTSKVVEQEKKRGQKSYEVNVRAVYGCRQIGSGYGHLKKLCCCLNMPEPMRVNNFDKLSNSIKNSVKYVAEKSMSAAAAELRGANETADVGVSLDGTWQRKGFTSLNGVITAISIDSGKALDVAILSKSCKGCTRMQGVEKSDPQQFDSWKASHRCNLNYKGSSPGMEKLGAQKIFQRSVQKHNLYYTSFYGDGDSKAFSAIKDVYGPSKPAKKFECVGHYQKRVGTRLRKKKNVTKGLGGKGRLTDAKIDTLQNYFGIALRQNVGNLDNMIKGCMASMYHVSEYHENCPMTEDSWCQYQKDRINRTNLYKSKGGLPLDVRKTILPVFVDLCKPEHLSKCIHGKTQNANESFNGMIWNRVPKATHVGIDVLSLGVYDAIAHFNDGEKASLDIMEAMNIQPGEFMMQASKVINVYRKSMSKYRMSEEQKKRRKVIRHNRKKKQDKDINIEGPSYEAGGF